MDREFHVLVHEEDGSYWAEVKELPGCFASGHDLDELKDAIIEAIGLYLSNNDPNARPPEMRIEELRVLVPA